MRVGDGPCDYAVLGNDWIAVVTEATVLRRNGRSVYTQFSGSRKRQLKRAHAAARTVIDLDAPPPTPLEEILSSTSR